MKKLLIILVLFLISCGGSNIENRKKEVQFSEISRTVETIEIKGHEYMLASTTRGGICIIHSYSCQCMNGYDGKEEEEKTGEFSSSF